MKSTGMVRKVDELGRIVVPIELRRTLDIGDKDSLEIFTDEKGRIILKKYVPKMSCQISGEISDDNLILAGGKLIVSRESAKELAAEISRHI